LPGDRVTDALGAAQRALTLALDHGERGWEAWSRWLLAETGARNGTLQAACDAYREALSLEDRLGMRPLVTHCHRGLGKLYRQMDKRELANQHLAMAEIMDRQPTLTPWPVVAP
jgi:hypothetical protein